MKSALILHGGWAGHQPEQCANLLAGLLRDDGWNVELSPTLDPLADGDTLVARYDLITPVWTMGKISPEQWAGLKHAVRSGVGLGGWHGGMADAFRENVEYQFMVGGQFVAHPGNIKPWKVEITDKDDPIMHGIGDFEIVTEQYYMHVDPALRVLAATTYSEPYGDYPWTAGARMPVVWKKTWGQGKVFFCSLGHTTADFDVPEAREITRRGLHWAAR